MMFYEYVTRPLGHHDDFETVLPSMFAGTSLACAALLVIMIRAAGSITAEKERDTWVSLVSTPVTPREIIWAKIAGSIYAARWFALPIGVWWLLASIMAPAFVVITPVIAATFGCIALTIAALGVWFSSRASTSIRAMAGAVVVGLILAGGYLMCCIPLADLGGGDEIAILALAPVSRSYCSRPAWAGWSTRATQV